MYGRCFAVVSVMGHVIRTWQVVEEEHKYVCLWVFLRSELVDVDVENEEDHLV